MTQTEQDEISWNVAQNQYYAGIVSIIFLVGATSSMVLGLSLGVLLILFYALFIPVGITLTNQGILIRKWLRKKVVEKSGVKLFIFGENDKKVLQVTFPNTGRFRQIVVKVENESQFAKWLENHGYEIGISA